MKRDHADPKMRLVAFFIDMGVNMALYLPALISAILGLGTITSLFLLLAPLLALVHVVGGWMFYGQTIGKALLGLRIVDLDAADKEGMTPVNMIKRILGYIACSLPFCLGFLMILKDPQGRGLHDQFANTIVIKED